MEKEFETTITNKGDIDCQIEGLTVEKVIVKWKLQVIGSTSCANIVLVATRCDCYGGKDYPTCIAGWQKMYSDEYVETVINDDCDFKDDLFPGFAEITEEKIIITF